MARPSRTLAMTLTPEQWDRLVRAAMAAERDPFQQARWLVLRGLEPAPSADADQEERETADVA